MVIVGASESRDRNGLRRQTRSVVRRLKSQVALHKVRFYGHVIVTTQPFRSKVWAAQEAVPGAEQVCTPGEQRCEAGARVREKISYRSWGIVVRGK